MKRLLDILRFSIISPEFFVLLVCMILSHYYPNLFGLIGNKLKSNNDMWKFIPTLPFVFVGVTFKVAQRVHAPLENQSNKQLYEWASFNKITDRIMASYLISIFCAGSSLIIWFFMSELSKIVLGEILLGSIVISGLTAFQMILAAQKIRQIMEQYS